MQLKRRTVLPVASGLLLVLASSEAFLRFSQIPAAKVVALILALLGVFLVAWPEGSRGSFVLPCVAGALFVLFAVQAAWRYPGLLKVEGSEFDGIDVAVLALEAGCIFGVSVTLANLVLRGLSRLKSAE